MPGFDLELLRRLEREREVGVRVRRRDGSTVDLPIWIVVVEGEPYVRSYRAERGAWYRRARANGRMTLVVGGQALSVLVRPVDEGWVNRHVSEAFIAKYGEHGPGRTMVSEAVTATTLRLTPAA